MIHPPCYKTFKFDYKIILLTIIFNLFFANFNFSFLYPENRRVQLAKGSFLIENSKRQEVGFTFQDNQK